ncbi:hypothetical protein LJK87_39210 [Paenibacillus sp. P25]|nr:hypothetical protein LJK87_39210 [Paenibacillus sp. P25]
MTLGITVFGIIQSHSLTRNLSEAFAGSGGAAVPQGISFSDPHAPLDPATRGQIPGSVLGRITEGLSSSIGLTFAWSLLPAVLALVAAFAMSRERMDLKAQAEGESYATSH